MAAQGMHRRFATGGRHPDVPLVVGKMGQPLNCAILVGGAGQSGFRRLEEDALAFLSSGGEMGKSALKLLVPCHCGLWTKWGQAFSLPAPFRRRGAR
jgi:hypothetical protein